MRHWDRYGHNSVFVIIPVSVLHVHPWAPPSVSVLNPLWALSSVLGLHASSPPQGMKCTSEPPESGNDVDDDDDNDNDGKTNSDDITLRNMSRFNED